MVELLEGIGHNIRRLREEKGWNQTELGFHADTSPSIISLIENAKRNPSTATLAKIAGALGVEVVELFPKATSRSSPEPSLFNGADDERRFAEIGELLERRHARRLRQVEDPTDSHFRNATAAATWIADVQEEADEVIRWLLEYGEALAGTWEDLGMIAGVALFAENPARLGEARLAEMDGKPDELAARRVKKTADDLEVSAQELGNAVNG